MNSVRKFIGANRNFPTFNRFFGWLFSWQIIRRLLITFAVVVTLVVLLYTVELVRGKWAWNKYVAETEARGNPLDIAAIIPPPVPDDENFAMIPLLRDSLDFITPIDSSKQLDLGPYFKALKSVKIPIKNGNWTEGERIDLSSWQAYFRAESNPDAVEKVPTSETHQSPAEDVLLALTLRKDALDQLQEGSNRRHARFPIDYEANFAALLPHLAPIKGTTQTLRLKALAHLEAGKADLAFQDTMLGFYLREAIKSEPLLICHLVRIAINTIMIHPVWEGIADGKWNEKQLVEFQQLFEGDNWFADYKQSILGERAFSIAALDMIRRGDWEIYNGIFGGSPDTGLTSVLIPSGWVYQNMLSICLWEDRFLLNGVDEKKMRLDMKLVNSFESDFGKIGFSPYNIFVKMVLPALSKAGLKAAHAQTASDRAAIACAIERYRLATGSLPKTLEQLVPAHMASLPHDVINGDPLKYKPEGNDRYLLYSVGANQTDDGGRFDDDWVWLYRRNSEIKK